MRKILLSVIAAGVVSATSVTPAALAGKPTSAPAYKSSAHETVCYDGDGNRVGSITYNGPDKLWPPNHKYVATYVVAKNDDGGSTTLTSTVTNSQYDGDTGTEANGAGRTLDDVKINPNNGSDASTGQGNVSATSEGDGDLRHDISLRAERAGTIQDARTYTLKEDATIDGNSCSATYTVAVPHDMRPSNR